MLTQWLFGGVLAVMVTIGFFGLVNGCRKTVRLAVLGTIVATFLFTLATRVEESARLAEYRAQGEWAARVRLPLSANPYLNATTPNPRAAQAWQEGWQQARGENGSSFEE